MMVIHIVDICSKVRISFRDKMKITQLLLYLEWLNGFDNVDTCFHSMQSTTSCQMCTFTAFDV